MKRNRPSLFPAFFAFKKKKSALEIDIFPSKTEDFSEAHPRVTGNHKHGDNFRVEELQYLIELLLCNEPLANTILR